MDTAIQREKKKNKEIHIRFTLRPPVYAVKRRKK